jgi:hypothetical protein
MDRRLLCDRAVSKSEVVADNRRRLRAGYMGREVPLPSKNYTSSQATGGGRHLMIQRAGDLSAGSGQVTA